jgi:ubiquinone biosynthesis protein Coq4
VQGEVGFLAITQEQMDVERPVAFLSRYLSKTELKWGHLEQAVALVSWGLRKARRYTSLAPEIVIVAEEEAEVACVAD